MLGHAGEVFFSLAQENHYKLVFETTPQANTSMVRKWQGTKTAKLAPSFTFLIQQYCSLILN